MADLDEVVNTFLRQSEKKLKRLCYFGGESNKNCSGRVPRGIAVGIAVGMGGHSRGHGWAWSGKLAKVLTWQGFRGSGHSGHSGHSYLEENL